MRRHRACAFQHQAAALGHALFGGLRDVVAIAAGIAQDGRGRAHIKSHLGAVQRPLFLQRGVFQIIAAQQFGGDEIACGRHHRAAGAGDINARALTQHDAGASVEGACGRFEIGAVRGLGLRVDLFIVRLGLGAQAHLGRGGIDLRAGIACQIAALQLNVQTIHFHA